MTPPKYLCHQFYPIISYASVQFKNILWMKKKQDFQFGSPARFASIFTQRKLSRA